MKKRLHRTVFFACLLSIMLCRGVNGEATCAIFTRQPDDPVQQEIIAEVRRQLQNDQQITLAHGEGGVVARNTSAINGSFTDGGVVSRVQLGAELDSELLVLMDTVTFSEATAVNLIVAETSMGIRLLVETFAWKKGKSESLAQAIVEAIRYANEKRRAGVSVVYAVPPFKCQDISLRYAYLMQPYATFVEQQLLAQEGAVVVEIEEAEAMLLASDGAKRPLPYFITGAFRNEVAENERTVCFSLTMALGNQTLETRQTPPLPLHETATVLQMTVAELVKTHVKAGVTHPFDARQECAGLVRQARDFSMVGYWKEAIALYHAALLVDPKSEEAALGLLDTYADVLKIPPTKMGHEFDIIELGERMADLLASLPEGCYVTGRDRISKAQGILCSYFHFFGSPIEVDETMKTRYRMACADLAETALFTLRQSSRKMNPDELTRTSARLAGKCADVISKQDPKYADDLWMELLLTLNPYSNGFSLQFANLTRTYYSISFDKLEASDNAQIRLVATLSHLVRQIRDPDSHDKLWKEIESVKGYDTLSLADQQQIRKVADTILQRRMASRKAEIITGATGLSLSNMTAHILAQSPAGASNVTDWIIEAGGLEYVSTDKGIHAVTGPNAFSLFAEDGAERMTWDGRHLWLLTAQSLSIRLPNAKEIAAFQGDALPFPLLADKCWLFSFEPGWCGFFAAEEKEGARRNWAANFDIRNAGADGAGAVTTFFEAHAQKDDGNTLHVAFTPSWVLRIGAPAEYKVGAYGNNPLCLDFKNESTQPLPKGLHRSFCAVNDQDTVWLAASDFEDHQQSWKIFRWGNQGEAPALWYEQTPYPYEEGGSGGSIFQAIFVDGKNLHLICHPRRKPAWFVLDLESKRVAVVTDRLPEELNAWHKNPRFVHSRFYGWLCLTQGRVYQVTLPPFDLLPKFQPPADKEAL